MLVELRIENFAIIQELALKFQPGLTTFTGETGAGKSIILDALDVLVGGKTDTSMIRSGAERALVEATFRLPEANRAAIVAILEREDLLDDPNYLVLGREIRREGRNVARVNGRSVSASLLRELGGFLVDIHGQSEHLSLLTVRRHLGLLDRYVGSEALLEGYRQTYRKLAALRREMSALRQSEQEKARRIDLLTFQAEEIEAARLSPGEEEELRQERDRLANAESLAQLVQQALLLLEEGSPDAPAISDLLGQVVQSMTAVSRIDASQSRLAEQAETLAETLNEISRELRHYQEQLEFNPRRLEQVEERLNLIHTLKRKYGSTIEAILAFGQNARQELEKIAHAEERITELEAEETRLLEQLTRQGLELSQLRRRAAEALAQAVEQQLADLSMAGARFQVEMQLEPDPAGLAIAPEQRVAFDENGIDRVQFLIAPNPGEELKPLVKIASGGETSRLMLALKNVLASADDIPCLIFDEIDQGIGGRVGMVVGEKLWQLARRHQVLCVTHLPQLAAFGDQHWRVHKIVRDGRTLTEVEQLDEQARLDELAQMLGNASAANRSAAQESLDRARRRTAELTQQP
jgi:DNA repair protein RecN (Recombination protein N)